ncbi:MAG: response regulator [Cytophagaceae bacterium]
MTFNIEINKLVVIDDDPIHNFIAKKLIDKFQIANNLRIISTVKEGIKFLEERCIKKTEGICPDIVLLDYHFPSMDAVEMLEKVREMGLDMRNHIILIVISASVLKTEVQEKLRSLGTNGFLIKPINENDIKKVIEIYCTEKLPG